MNPRMKLAYFQREEWPEAWIEAAKDCVRNEWARYKPAALTSQPRESEGGFFAKFDEGASSTTIDALEEYFQTPPIPSVADPIKYWHSLNDGNTPLARMALDILSAPG
ncbi:hypothetical protein C8Q76DRAFT_599002, partial [Earliella scabrosa]